MANYTPKQLEMPLFEARIPLSKKSRHAGKYETIVSPIDAEYLMQFNWAVMRKRTIYARKTIYPNGKKKTVLMHREILERVLERKLERHEHVDHINGNGLDNRRENLRLATNSQNHMNQQKRSDNTSGYKGVSWRDSHKKWLARVQVDGKRFHLGYFDTPELAYQACCDAREKYHGEFARHD